MILAWLAVALVAGGIIAAALRWRQVAEGPDLADRVEDFAAGHSVTVLGVNLPYVVVRTLRRCGEVRVTGLAAEMTYYALISLLPLASALGAALGFVERLAGAREADRLERAIVDGVGRVFDDEIATDVITPIVEGTLRQERAGLAIGSIVIAIWLASRMFRAAVRALDDAYQVAERRTLLQQILLGVALSFAAIVTVLVLVSLIVIGPLFGSGREVAEAANVGGLFDDTWNVLRWPVAAGVCIVFLIALYRFAPNVDTTWRRCWPGAVLGTLGLIVIAWGFQLYLQVAGPRTPQLDESTMAVDIATQLLGAVLAGVLWVWLSSIVVLAGGVLNAEITRVRERTRPVGDGG